MTYRTIPVALIDADPGQARKYFDPTRLAELAESMGINGLAVPVSVRPDGDRFILVHGERRWRAARSLDWETIPANVLDIDAEAARWLALAENVQRDDLTPMEEAEAYRAALATGITQGDLGRRLGKSQSYVAQKLRLLTLPESIRIFLARGALSEGHARLLLRFRPFYGDETCTFPPDVDSGTDWEEPTKVLSFYTALRPLDTPFWFPAPGAADPLLRDAGRAFLAEVRERGGVIPSWIVAASWFAAMVAHRRCPVAELVQIIDGWEDLILSAVLYLHERVNPEAATGVDVVEGIDQKHRSDLRHARLGHWETAPPDRIKLKALEMALSRGLAWPSAIASQGPRVMSRDIAQDEDPPLSAEDREEMEKCEAAIQAGCDNTREVEKAIEDVRRLLGPERFEAWKVAEFGDRWPVIQKTFDAFKGEGR